ncbi:acyl-CoA dehydrogenase family protein [Microbacterium sp. NPDC090225]|uniref:acyl-CoA dehydrogenase family protein n=1 Tax=Microbacterium sp. NPDC090225 TaxID=3364207 RepID=UPI0038001A48
MTSRPFGSLDWARRTPGIPALLDEIRQASTADAPELPQSFFTRLAAAGFGRIRVPVAEGGLGGDVLDLLDALLAIAAADSNLAQAWRTHVLATERHVKSPAGALRDRWISRVAEGSIIGGGWTEADGSGPSVFTTRLSTETGVPRLTGRKFYSTGSRYADWLEYSAVDDAGDLVIAALPVDAEGVTLLDDWTGFGQRATASGTTVLDGAPVDPDDVAPWQTQHLGTPGWQQMILLAVLVGIGEGARAAASDLVDQIDRAHGGSPILVLEGYGRISALVASARASLGEIGRLSEIAHQAIIAGDADAETLADDAVNAVFQAQATIVPQVIEAADKLMTLPALLEDIAEAQNLRQSLRLDRFWRNAQTLSTHNPVLHRLRAIADREIYAIDRIADPAEREVAVAQSIADGIRPLTVVRLDAALAARLAAAPRSLDAVAAAFGGREPVLFQFDERPGAHFDAAVAIATLLHRLPTAWFAVGTGDLSLTGHPYNLARRIASLEQLSGGRTAWVLDDGDTETEEQRDRIRVVQQLLRTWPQESIAADAGARHFAQTESIRRINADGAFPTAGPLNVPSSPQHLPVFVSSRRFDDVHRYVDLLVRDDAWVLPYADAAGHPLATGHAADDIDGLLAIAGALPVIADGSADAGSDAVADAAPETLRARLRLPAPALYELPGASARFERGSETEAS